ncbi:MAG: DUF3795 domain-containing protein [Bacteroidota bacterium]|nr:DUF3795 domain-containing protein [Bacteroidota bacterium]
MDKLIACCGLDCATCDARIATVADDDKLREETAKKWKEQFNAPNILPETINCTGCREEGAKFAHCYECEIRNCVTNKGYATCADCDSLESCQIVGEVLKFVPEALENLKKLN